LTLSIFIKKDYFSKLSVKKWIDFRKFWYKMIDKWEKVVKSGVKWV